MATAPKKVVDRFQKEIMRFQRVLKAAKDRDINESDTVAIITDVLADVFGFDKYADITREFCVRNTFCDLAIKIDGKVQFLIEVKAIGLDLKENHLRQAINYGANQGIPWVVLTNGIAWEIYHIRFEKPIDADHVCSLDLLTVNPRRTEDQERLFLLCKEGISKSAMDEFAQKVQSVNRFVIGAIISSEPVISVIRKELRRLSDGIKVEHGEVEEILLAEVLKREVIEGEAATKARATLKKSAKAAAKVQKKPTDQSAPSSI